MSGTATSFRIDARVAAALLTILFAVVVLRNAWMHDDAYITYRTVDNFINGYGLRWNPAERVQTYTHPLWMLVVAACYFVTREVFFTVTILSLALSVATVLLLVFRAAGSVAAGCVGVAALTLSKAFVDYSTSGLENALTHFLYVSFLVVFFRRDTSLMTIALLAALGAVNRLDTALLYLPVLVFAVANAEHVGGRVGLAAGCLPIVVWEGFSLFYYGFPFPNTAYAKLFETGVSTGTRVMHGLYYLQNSARVDPLTLLATGAGIVAGVLSRDRRQAVVAAGIAAYVSYVVLIGGDFVTGRFLTATFLGAIVLLARWQPLSRTLLAVSGAVVIGVGLSSSQPPPLSTASAGSEGLTLMDARGIADERAYYYPYSGFLRAFHHVTVADHPWALEGQAARRRPVPVQVRGDIGFFGFYAGPDVHVVDVWGLADPLIARLPARADTTWRVGHYTRAIPAGYLETLSSGQNRIADRQLALLYDRLTLVTRGPLLDRRRLVEIWKINVGGWGADVH
jgi:arabinofuranosyltransferase